MSSDLNRIIFKNLVNRSDLNGQRGIVKGWDVERLRFRVNVTSTNEKVFVKASNLEHEKFPRFPIGEAVFINVGRRWAPGRVIARKHFYTEDLFPPKVGPIVPYQIEKDDGGLVYAPSDDDRCVRKRITDFSELLQYLKENPHLLYDLSFMESYSCLISAVKQKVADSMMLNRKKWKRKNSKCLKCLIPKDPLTNCCRGRRMT